MDIIAGADFVNRITTGYNLLAPFSVLAVLCARWWAWQGETDQSRGLLLAHHRGRLYFGLAGAFVCLVVVWRGFWAAAMLTSGEAIYADWAQQTKHFLVLPIIAGIACMCYAWHPMIARALGSLWWVGLALSSAAVFGFGCLVAV